MPVVALEGVDGSGKSTVAGILRKQDGAEVIFPSAKVFKPRQSSIVAGVDDYVTRDMVHFFDVMAQATDQAMMVLKSRPNPLIVFDRYCYSIVANHIALDFVINNGSHSKAIMEMGLEFASRIMRPDLVVRFTIDSDTRMQRVLHRKKRNSDGDTNAGYINAVDAALDRVLGEAQRLGLCKLLKVDTTGTSANAVANAVKRELEIRSLLFNGGTAYGKSRIE